MFLKKKKKKSPLITTISLSFCFPGHALRSSSTATLAMRAQMARHRLKTRCMTPTWSLLRQKLSGSIPHSIQSARWYSLTNKPLPIQWSSPAAKSQWGVALPNGEARTNLQIKLVTMSSLCCSMLGSLICTVMQLCSTSYLNDGITSHCRLTRQNKLEPVNKGVDKWHHQITWICCSRDHRWDQTSSALLLFRHSGHTQRNGRIKWTFSESDNVSDQFCSSVSLTSVKFYSKLLMEGRLALLIPHPHPKATWKLVYPN